jgi:hypothetical protein
MLLNSNTGPNWHSPYIKPDEGILTIPLFWSEIGINYIFICFSL